MQNAANVALEVMQRVVKPGRFDDRRAELYRPRRSLHEALRNLRDIERQSDDYWASGAHRVFVDGQTADELAADWAVFQTRLQSVALAIGGVITDAAAAIAGSNDIGDEVNPIRSLLASLARDSPELTLRRLLALDVDLAPQVQTRRVLVMNQAPRFLSFCSQKRVIRRWPSPPLSLSG